MKWICKKCAKKCELTTSNKTPIQKGACPFYESGGANWNVDE